MTLRILSQTAFLATLVLAGGARAEEAAPHAGHGAVAPAALPAGCTTAAPKSEAAASDMAKDGSMTHGINPVQAGNMAAMSAMDGPMMRAAMIVDADLAFNCGMIAHHLGAIAMSKVELEHGKDPKSRALAEAIIAAQEKEIAEMTAWVEGYAK
jgi:uncharacterized protein (DUF305 family)